MSQVHEVRREAGVAATEKARRFLELPTHRLLLVVRRVEARERRNRDVGMTGLVVRGPRERWIHDDQIARFVLDGHRVLPTAAVSFHATQRLASGEQRKGVVRVKKVECTDVCPDAVDAVGHCVNLRFPVGERGMGAGKHRARQMGCGGHDVQPSQNVLHQGSMQVLVIAAGPAVAAIHRPLRGREQGSSSAGEVREPQAFDSGPVRPVHVQPLDRQFRKQTGRCRQRVEGREELTVRDEGLEHPPREVVIGSRAQLRQLGDGLCDAVHDWRHGLDWQFLH